MKNILIVILVLFVFYLLFWRKPRCRLYREWGEHVFWTRNFIVEAFSGRPTDSIINRLMVNQKQLSQGDDVLEQLLKKHISIAGQIVNVLIQQLPIDIDLQFSWKRNAIQIANRLNMPVEEMLTHLDTTMDEIIAIASGNFQCVPETDAVIKQAWKMSREMS